MVNDRYSTEERFRGMPQASVLALISDTTVMSISLIDGVKRKIKPRSGEYGKSIQINQEALNLTESFDTTTITLNIASHNDLRKTK